MGGLPASATERAASAGPAAPWDARIDAILTGGRGKAGVAGALALFEPAVPAPALLALPFASAGASWSEGDAGSRPLGLELGGPAAFLDEEVDPTTVPEPRGIGLAILGASVLLLSRRARRGRA